MCVQDMSSVLFKNHLNHTLLYLEGEAERGRGHKIYISESDVIVVRVVVML